MTALSNFTSIAPPVVPSFVIPPAYIPVGWQPSTSSRLHMAASGSDSSSSTSSSSSSLLGRLVDDLEDRDGPFRSGSDFELNSRHPHRHRGQKLRASVLRRERERQRRLAEEEDRKQRRSLNIADPNREKTTQLYKWRHNSVVEMTSDGRVRTTTNTSSVYSVLLVVFWCEIMHNCPVTLNPMEQTSMSTASPNVSTTFSHILLQFKETNRFACINERGELYSRLSSDPYDDGLRDCVFHHQIISRQYDVYKSLNHPASCSSSADQRHRQRHRQPSEDQTSSSCRSSWYLGVSRDGSVRVVKTSGRLPQRNTFFYQTWVHKQTPGNQRAPSDTLPNIRTPFDTTPVAMTTRPPSVSARRPPKNKSRPAFPLLSGRRRGGSSKLNGWSSDSSNAEDNVGEPCGSNLLSRCSGTGSAGGGRRSTGRRTGDGRRRHQDGSDAATATSGSSKRDRRKENVDRGGLSAIFPR